MDHVNSKPSFELLNIDLENYFSNTIIPQLFVDGKLILRKFTPPAMRQFSLSATDIGRPVSDLSDNIRFPGIIENIQQVMHAGTILEKEIQTTDRRWYQMNILPYVVSETGRPNGVIITFIDITIRINDLKELEKLISDHQILIDTISHDIKNPITNIVLAIDLIKSAADAPPDILSGIEIIERAATRIKLMIDDLNNLRKESSIQNTEAELLHVENVVEDVCLALVNQINEGKAVLKQEIHISEMNFSRRKLRSLLYNLISNSIKYRSAERPCKISISTYKEKDSIVIRVEDNGIGIAHDKHEAIFAKYYRIGETGEGTGVGLYLVREIVRTAGGEIKIDSAPGKGAVFTVYLPASQVLPE